jgi:hypothetical protein
MPIKFDASLINKNILHLQFDNIRDEAVTLFRLSEFYESPYEEINGTSFGIDDFLLSYSKPNGELTYFKDWPAFNIPGHVFNQFKKKFKNLTRSEQMIYQLVEDHLDTKLPYYVISNISGDRGGYEHEFAHALYYTNQDYKNEMDSELTLIPKKIKTKLYRGLKRIGYPMTIQHIVDDESQAWLATSYKRDFENEFNFIMEEIQVTHRTFKKIFKNYTKAINVKTL